MRAGCARGSEQSWSRLLEAVRQMAMDLARGSYRMGPEDAEDLAQLVLIRVSTRLPQLRSPEAFPLWVRRVVHHVALDMLRQRRSLLSLDEMPTPAAEMVTESDTADPSALGRRRADLRRAPD